MTSTCGPSMRFYRKGYNSSDYLWVGFCSFRRKADWFATSGAWKVYIIIQSSARLELFPCTEFGNCHKNCQHETEGWV